MWRPLSESPALDAALAPARGRPLIVFDGDCVVCSRGAAFVLRRDRARRFALTTAQSATGQALYGALGLSSGLEGTMLLVERGTVATESDAILAVAAGLGWPWRAARWVRLVPISLRDQAYGFIARNRFRWFGRRETCWVASPRDRDRIL